MGWMMLEFIPVYLWSRLTGAFSFQGGFYLVTYLATFGVTNAQLAWLPLLFFGGTAVQAVIILRRRDRHGRLADARRTCLRDTLLGRAFWLVAFAWPMLASSLELGLAWLYGGFLACVFLGQLFLLASASAWATWTQGIVHPRQRGSFYAWRNFTAFGCFLLVLGGLTASEWWPADGASAGELQHWYFGLFMVLCVIALLATWPLALAPRMPDEAHLAQRSVPPLREALAHEGAFKRYALWNACHMASIACTLTWLQPLLAEIGISDLTYARAEAWARTPMMFAGILIAGAMQNRVGSHRLLAVMNLALVIGVAILLMLDEHSPGWLLAIALAAEGFGLGMTGIVMLSRLQEIIPRGDARFPALCTAAGGLGGMAVALVLVILLPQLDPDPSIAWLIIAAGCLIRLLSLPLLFDGRKHADHDHDAFAATPEASAYVNDPGNR